MCRDIIIIISIITIVIYLEKRLRLATNTCVLHSCELQPTIDIYMESVLSRHYFWLMAARSCSCNPVVLPAATSPAPVATPALVGVPAKGLERGKAAAAAAAA